MQHRLITAAACAVLVGSVAFGVAVAAPVGPVARMHALFDRGWAEDMKADPLGATYVGDTA